MKKRLILVLACMGVASSNCSIIRKLEKIGATLGLFGSRALPEKFKPCQTWLYPHILFHGSPCSDLAFIEPHKLDERCHGQPIVFASHHIALACLFMLRHKGKFACGRLPNGDFFYMTDDKKRCILDDKGGAIYLLPATTFFCEAYVSLGVDEWVSYATIRPLAQFTFKSALDALLDFGVKIYFVDRYTYDRYWRTSSSEDSWNAFFRPLAFLTKAQLVQERVELGIS